MRMSHPKNKVGYPGSWPCRVRVRDAGSTNGTWFGPHKIEEIELATGGEILVGDTLLRLEMDDGAHATPVSSDQEFGELVGCSTPMRELFAALERVAPKSLS